MVDWDYFVKVRHLIVDRWLTNRNITTYDDFCDKLKASGVIAPSKDVFDSYFPVVNSVVVVDTIIQVDVIEAKVPVELSNVIDTDVEDVPKKKRSRKDLATTTIDLADAVEEQSK